MLSSTTLFDNGRPAKELLELLSLTRVDHDGTLTGIHAATQTAWRVQGAHSGDIPKAHDVTTVSQALTLLHALGFLGEQSAERLQYRYGALFGAYILAVRKRFALLLREWNFGLRFDHLVLLGGKRPRNDEKESIEILQKADGGLELDRDWRLDRVPETEDEIMLMVLQQSKLPDAWKQPGFVTVVDTPRFPERQKPDPSAEDTLDHWLNGFKPTPGTVLGVYSQPQLRHIEAVCRRKLKPRGFEVDCIGYAAPAVSPEAFNLAQALDSVAKVVHEYAIA